MSDNSDTKKRIEELGPWFHNIHLPGGHQTAPDHFLGDFPAFKWEKIKEYIPEDLSGKTVLDIGCNAGFYSLELARRGAEVTAIDFDTNYLDQADWVISRFGLEEQITLKQQQVYDLAREDKQYDIIWFMGVFYHLRYPLLALDTISRKTHEMLVFQTLTMPDGEDLEPNDDYTLDERDQMVDPDWPKMAFIEKQLNGDPTNWWIANRSCIKAMLRSCGLQITDRPEREIFLCKPDPGNPGVSRTWNESEYLSSIGRDWKETYQKKIR